jgi:L-threonylcarbamoyladenylate synthase
VPSHPIAQQVLTELKAIGVLGLVAPSANRFGHVSPTTSAHVAADLGQYLDAHQDLILEGGECEVGLESTIVLALDEFPVILRPGAITADDILRITGIAVVDSTADVPRVSGALDSHYSPMAKVVLIADPAHIEQTNAGLLALADIDTPSGVQRLAAPKNLEEYAHQLYAALRSADDLNLETIYVVPPSGTGLAQAIIDRLQRAAV